MCHPADARASPIPHTAPSIGAGTTTARIGPSRIFSLAALVPQPHLARPLALPRFYGEEAGLLRECCYATYVTENACTCRRLTARRLCAVASLAKDGEDDRPVVVARGRLALRRLPILGGCTDGLRAE